MTNDARKFRIRAYSAQKGRCIWCGCLMWEPALEALPAYEARTGWAIAHPGFVKCTAEHLTPRSDGGRTAAVNIAAACSWCNQVRHRRMKDLTVEAYRALALLRVKQRRWNYGFAPFWAAGQRYNPPRPQIVSPHLIKRPQMLRTQRLLLRPWRDEDRAPFAALNADPQTMQHFPATLTRAESDALVDRLIARRAETGLCFMAVERRSDAAFIGMVGLNHVGYDTPFTPAVEIGWRILREHEGQGYVTEAARAWLDHGFQKLNLPRIVAFTVPANTRSRAVMTRLGMTHIEDGDFDHPNLPAGHPLQRHVLYALYRP